jgi:hypothetical protein
MKTEAQRPSKLEALWPFENRGAKAYVNPGTKAFDT